MSLKKALQRGSPFVALFLVMTSFQNCSEQGQFATFSAMDMASTAMNSSGEDTHLSHSGADHTAPTAKQADIEYSPVVMDRRSVVYLFDDVFGPGARNLAAVKSIARDPNIFGGGCSVYRQSGTAPSDITTFCANTNAALSVKPLMGVTVLRQGRINQACYELAENATTIKYILARIDATKAVPEVTAANVTNLFNLFYRTKPAPPSGLIEAIAVNIGETTLAGWKRGVYGVCVSGHWQVL